MDSPVDDVTTQGARGADFASRENIDVLRVRFEQYKLAVEMADRMSSKRQAANQFFIGLLSAFGAFYAWLDKLPLTDARSAAQIFVPFLPVCLCAIWWSTIEAHRRINKAKWKAIYKIEMEGLPAHPYIDECKNLKSTNPGPVRRLLTYSLRRRANGVPPVRSPPPAAVTPTAAERASEGNTFSLTKRELAVVFVIGILFLLLAMFRLWLAWTGTAVRGPQPT